VLSPKPELLTQPPEKEIEIKDYGMMPSLCVPQLKLNIPVQLNKDMKN